MKRARKWTVRQRQALIVRQMKEAARIMNLPTPLDARWLTRLAEAVKLVSDSGIRVTAKSIASAADWLADGAP